MQRLYAMEEPRKGNVDQLSLTLGTLAIDPFNLEISNQKWRQYLQEKLDHLVNKWWERSEKVTEYVLLTLNENLHYCLCLDLR